MWMRTLTLFSARREFPVLAVANHEPTTAWVPRSPDFAPTISLERWRGRLRRSLDHPPPGLTATILGRMGRPSRWINACVTAASLLLVAASPLQNPTYDLLIVGGTVVDGSGAAPV